jgi:predicted acylesterase/phospholipase RssA
MESFTLGVICGTLIGAFVGFVVCALISANRAGAFQQADDEDKQIQAAIDYQSMTALEEEFMFAKTAR